MKNLLLLTAIVFALACTKTDQAKIPTSASHVFFRNETEMNNTVQTALEKLSPGEKMEAIKNVSYIDSKDKSYALVFYRSNKRAGNLLLERRYQNGVLFSATSITCEGASCACKVLTTISDAGSVTVNCSCSSCTMLTNNTVISTISQD